MKNKLISIIIVTFIITTLDLYGQCVVDAGSDRNLCPDEIQNNPQLYGAIISGDVIEIKWESEYYFPALNKYYYASTMLNDTTILQPTIVQHFEKTVKYYLKAVTSTNETCIDSVEINFSDWTVLTIDKMTGKLPTDTIQLWSASQSNWPHVHYEWSPNYMISDTTIEKPFVWNDTTVFYNLIITDSLGCSFTDDIFEVYTFSSSSYEQNISDLVIFPNPTNNRLTFKSNNYIANIKIYDSYGNVLNIYNEYNDIDITSLKSGLLTIRVNYINGNYTIKKVVKINAP